MQAAIKNSDIDFLVEKFSRLTDKREYELPSEYIQKVRYIDKSLSPFPGKFSYEKFPYFVEIVNRLSPADPTKYIFVMKGNQCGYTTTVLEPGMMYYIGSQPEEQALYLPDGTMATDYAQTKLESCLDNCGLRPLIGSQTKKRAGPKTRATQNYTNNIRAARCEFTAAEVATALETFPTRLFLRTKPTRF